MTSDDFLPADTAIEANAVRRRYAGGFEAVSGISLSVARGELFALLGRPEVLFLDEPTTGLDAEGRRDTWRLVQELREGGTTVLLTTQYAGEALATALAHRPDVAVLDLEMPGADGVKVATSLRAELPGCRTVIVTSHGRPRHLKRALAAGVRALVPKTVSARRLAEIIRTVHAGNRYVDPELAADAISAGDPPLTAREAEVLELAADGAPVADIAERASLSQGTVRNYLSPAVSELGAENRHAAVRLARQRGWV
ncbi:response regulator [Streptomyces sp. NPDC057136]|uniref:response regulator n=1 Tax=Streptomyces sp. NPDC057136 TaxID=3346029 RepID=UPI00363F3C56